MLLPPLFIGNICNSIMSKYGIANIANKQGRHSLASVSLSHIRVIQISRPLSEIPGQGDGVQREVRRVGGGRQGPGRLPPLEQCRGPREAQLEPKLRLCRPRPSKVLPVGQRQWKRRRGEEDCR